MRPKYRVTGHYATVKTMTESGPRVIGLLKGAMVPPDVEQSTIDHLLDVGLITPLPGAVEPIGPGWDVPPKDEEPADGPPAAEPTGDDLDERRAQARAKLPKDGSAPKKTHGQQVWVEYAVARGYDRALVEAATKDELIEMLC